MGTDDNFKDGAFQISRSLYKSDIWKMPPHYLKVWLWLLGKAQHEDWKNLKRGQCKISIPQTIEETAWKVGYRTETLTFKQVRGVYDFLTKGNMIVTTKVTHGMVVTICNYDSYQTLSNYEGHNEGHNEGKVEGTIKTRMLKDYISSNEEMPKNGKPGIPEKMNAKTIVGYFADLYKFYFEVEYLPVWNKDTGRIQRLWIKIGKDIFPLIDHYLAIEENQRHFWTTRERTIPNLTSFINQVQQHWKEYA